VRPRLSLIDYNRGNLWRRLVLPARIDNWSLTSSQQRLVKTGAGLTKHARYYWLLLDESHLTRRLFAGMRAEDRGAAVAGSMADCWIADKMAPGRARQGPVSEESVSKSS